MNNTCPGSFTKKMRSITKLKLTKHCTASFQPGTDYQGSKIYICPLIIAAHPSTSCFVCLPTPRTVPDYLRIRHNSLLRSFCIKPHIWCSDQIYKSIGKQRHFWYSNQLYKIVGKYPQRCIWKPNTQQQTTSLKINFIHEL